MSHDLGLPEDVASVASIEQRLRDMGAQVSSWSHSPGDRYSTHEHGYDKVIVAMQGAVTFLLPATGRSIELRAGDRPDLPAGTSHAAMVGPAGVRCLEAHLPAGSLGADTRRVAGWTLGDPSIGPVDHPETADGTGT
ncbi:MAG: hypothetical protein LH650_02865 [Chloroflexi bacterium]|nr:hypothetical protein [Chloroflexota bacterium]